jgi:Terminase small subunit
MRKSALKSAGRSALSPKQQRFVQEYLQNHNGTQAAILVDGLSVVTNDAGAQAIGKLQQQLQDAQTAAGTAAAAHQAAIAVKDAAIAKAEGERDALKSQILSDADLDKRVQERGDLIAKAEAVHDADYSGKSDADGGAVRGGARADVFLPRAWVYPADREGRPVAGAAVVSQPDRELRHGRRWPVPDAGVRPAVGLLSAGAGDHGRYGHHGPDHHGVRQGHDLRRHAGGEEAVDLQHHPGPGAGHAPCDHPLAGLYELIQW